MKMTTTVDMPLVMSVQIVARDPVTLWWCGRDVAVRISEFVDTSTECSISNAIREDQVYLLQRMFQRLQLENEQLHFHASAIQGALEAAAQRGCLAVVQWLVLHHPTLVGRARLLDKAAAGGQLELLCWLHIVTKVTPSLLQEGCSTDAMDEAAGNGFLDVVQWLHAHHYKCTTRAMDNAATNGYLVVVQWLHRHRTEGCTTLAMDGACRNNHLAIVQFLHGNRLEGASSRAMAGAAERGHLAIVQFLMENRLDQHDHAETAMAYAAWRGHVAVVQFLLEQRVAAAEMALATSCATGASVQVQ